MQYMQYDYDPATAPLKDVRGPKLAQAVAQFIAEKAIHQDGLKMGDWGMRTSCGTQACFAGWTLILTGHADFEAEWHEGYMRASKNEGDDTISERASKLLELDEGLDEGGPYLFYWTEVYEPALNGGYEIDFNKTIARMWSVLADEYGPGVIEVPEEYRS